jgi:hypothetical protein
VVGKWAFHIDQDQESEMNRIFFLYPVALLAVACTSAPEHRADVQDNSADRVTVGVVQKDIYIGMPSSAVIESIGSPNVVTTNENRNEVWVYDKLATDVVHSESSSSIWGVIFGPLGSAGGGASGNSRQSSGATSMSQRTLTIVIRFDADHRVNDFAYHSSRF